VFVVEQLSGEQDAELDVEEQELDDDNDTCELSIIK